MTAPRLAPLAALALLPACFVSSERFGDAREHFDGSGRPATVVCAVGDFHAVEVQGRADVVATVGGATHVELTADDNLLERFRIEVRDGTLVVEMKDGSYSFEVHPVVTVATPRLDAVRIRGSGDASIEGLEGGAFEAEIQGSGDVRATGRVERLTATVRGSGDLELGGLEARAADVRISGSGDVEVCATGSLDAEIHGSGDVVYRGAPEHLSTVVHGSGSIRRR
jgi:Putative auto-transporter adhesin, head GIN domain